MQAADLTILLLMQLDSINSWIFYMVFIHDNSTEKIWLWLSWIFLIAISLGLLAT